MINRMKRFSALFLAFLMVSTSTIGVFAQENALLEEEIRHELMEEGELSNSIDLGVEDINEELKEIYPYGEIVEVQETEYGTAYYVDSEFHKTRKKRAIAPWDALDVVMAGASWSDFFNDPSLKNLGWAAFDTAATFPGLPSSAYIRKGGKKLFKVAELKKYAKTSRGKSAIKKALKPVNAKVSKATSELARISRLAKNYKLSNSAYSHILTRHGANRAARETGGKFISSFNIRSGIRSTLTSDSVIRNNTKGRSGYTFIKNFNTTIGYDGRKSLKKLKVVLNSDGHVVTAFPVK